MDRTEALYCLKNIAEPLLVDGGYSKLGHLFHIVTPSGLVKVDCRVYDPIIGPIEISDELFLEISEIAKACESIAENDELDPDEKLFLFNNGRPGVAYWAFQPCDEAPLEACTFSADKALVEKKFIEQSLALGAKPWDQMNATLLLEWAGKIATMG